MSERSPNVGSPRVRVALLEAGQENHYEASYYSTGILAMWKGETNWHLASTPQTELGERTIDHPRGRVIGGSAALNVGSWSRGNAAGGGVISRRDLIAKLGRLEDRSEWAEATYLTVYHTKVSYIIETPMNAPQGKTNPL